MEEKVIIASVKKCPFCGESAVIGTYEYDFDRGYAKTYFVRCGKCHSETLEGNSVEQVVDRWNRRVPDKDLGESDIIKFVDE